MFVFKKMRFLELHMNAKYYWEKQIITEERIEETLCVTLWSCIKYFPSSICVRDLFQY